ncbi:uncharacterized protein LOC118827718 [Colossoma macropomum]|uniref:uncharacterized protein LOC118827718 n=1 Tax=Colossoma macropomum TaxID=42526 RepID=UPI00186557AD|nr:uncharacterized protein LOC118827718 [Colossoma macropomum]
MGLLISGETGAALLIGPHVPSTSSPAVYKEVIHLSSFTLSQRRSPQSSPPPQQKNPTTRSPLRDTHPPQHLLHRVFKSNHRSSKWHLAAPTQSDKSKSLSIRRRKTSSQEKVSPKFLSTSMEISVTEVPPAFLWYKRGSDKPVTRIQFSFRKEMDEGLSASGFTKINANIGTKTHPMYLWYISGSTGFDIPILDLTVTTSVEEEPELVRLGWERQGCDLQRDAGGDAVHVWVKRSEPSYNNGIVAIINFSNDASSFQDGFIRVDEDTNRGVNPPGSAVFLWCACSTDQSCVITDVDVSLNQDQEKELQAKGYEKGEKNLNDGTTGDRVYLWTKFSENSPAIQFFTVLVGDKALSVYKNANVCKVVEKNLNSGNNGVPLYVAYK